jgi:hypothetical protein
MAKKAFAKSSKAFVPRHQMSPEGGKVLVPEWQKVTKKVMSQQSGEVDKLCRVPSNVPSSMLRLEANAASLERANINTFPVCLPLIWPFQASQKSEISSRHHLLSVLL